jgi:hypothetical protein
MNISELVYESLIGELVDPIKDVPNAFEPGSYCETRYRQVLEAYERLRGRLGVTDEDPDVEIIIDSLLEIQRKLCMEMFDLAGFI